MHFAAFVIGSVRFKSAGMHDAGHSPWSGATVAVARAAMNTRFEILLQGDDPVSLRAAGEEALDEIERLEAQLSLFRPTSEIARINRDASLGPVRVSPNVFRLLAQAAALSAATGGAFDPSIGPLVACWGFHGRAGRVPDPAAIAAARERVGMSAVELDPTAFTVRFARPGMTIDLGAIGKGHAIDVAIATLCEAGIRAAFLHGGTSSSAGMGHPPDAPGWKAAIPDPRPSMPNAEGAARSAALLAAIDLNDTALGVSGVFSKSFTQGTRAYGHVIDPRAGEPVQRALLAAVSVPSAAEADALSTALLTLGPAGFATIRAFRPEARLLVVEQGETATGLQVLTDAWPTVV